MKKYHWLMKQGRRDLLLLSIFLVVGFVQSFVGYWMIGLTQPTAWVDLLIMSPLGAFYLAGALVYFLNIYLPPTWFVDRHGVRCTLYESGRIEPDFADWIKRPEIRKHFEDMKDFPVTGPPGSYPD